MDLSSTVRTDTLPAIATVLAPGALATTPFAWLILSGSSELTAFLATHEAVSVTAAVLVWTVAGFSVESIGSYVEVYGIDQKRDDRAEMLETWWRYLRVAWDKEPVGQGYLRNLLVSFKFELNMFVASVVAVFGFSLLLLFEPAARGAALGCIVFLGAAAVLLFQMAKGSADLLADVREQLVRGVGLPPFDGEGRPRANA